MPLRTQDLLNLASDLANTEDLRVTLNETVKWGAITAATTIAGGLLLGPAGLLLGSVAGGATGAIVSGGKFKSVSEIIMNDLTEEQKTLLANRLRRIVEGLDIQDAAVLLPILARDPNTTRMILNEITNFVTQELQMQIME